MSSKARFLTKSRFKMACECPTKLYYTGKIEYGNNNLDNDFLIALAEGGYQVGELAKLYSPGGTDIKSLNHDESIAHTEQLLAESPNVVMYEPAFKFGDLFIRIDVFEKVGKKVNLIEVKAKSFDPEEEDPFYDKRALKRNQYKLKSKWKPYLFDVAFQTYVLSKAKPDYQITPFLCLANKGVACSVDGLNQRFLIKETSGRKEVQVKPGTEIQELGEMILVRIDVSEQVKLIHSEWEKQSDVAFGDFAETVKRFSSAYSKDEEIVSPIGSGCKDCEYRIDSKKFSTDTKSGFSRCWERGSGHTAEELEEPLVIDVWNYRGAQKLIESGTFLMRDIEKSQINIKDNDDPSLTSSERQWVQVEKVKEFDGKPYIDEGGLHREFASWKYPLHFIDFETTMLAIPANKGRRPYEQIAFQFSHHTIDEAGRISHATEWINTERGKFPNFDFVRALRSALGDKGTIFRFATHENAVLCQIYQQLLSSDERDKNDLCDWIKTVTKSTGSADGKWEGERSMVDLCEIEKKHYYHPRTNGSNSIKFVLPAVLNESTYLQEKYSAPIYGTASIPSKNFEEMTWIKKNSDGVVINPYKQLPPMFEGMDTKDLDLLLNQDTVADGGAAMTAYAKMQFSEMSELEEKAIRSALLKYCELDTLAMVLIYEYWANLIGLEIPKKSAA